MKGHITAAGSKKGEIPVSSEVEIYRNSGDTQEVLALTDTGEVSLGIEDPTVSRKKGGQPPIIIRRHTSYLEIENRKNANTVKIELGGSVQELEQGHTKRIKRDATLSIGYQTDLLLEVERESKTEVNVDGDVSGGIVMGDNVDQSTTVEDSVVNRSDIGEGGADVKDSAVNRSDIGSTDSDSPATAVENEADTTDTQNFCEFHELTYTGKSCPECEREKAQTGPTDEDTVETKYCIYCGEEIPSIAEICPECGDSLPKM